MEGPGLSFANGVGVSDLCVLFLQNASDHPFFVADLDDVYRKHLDWLKHMPRVQPFYAVKSNHDTVLLKLLAHLGAGFDCSSKCEIGRILGIGVHPDRITYANPSKHASFIRFAGEKNVKKIVFDNEYELVKIKENHPKAECILRIMVKSLPAKFGADIETAKLLIRKAIELHLNLVGICFYVGFRQKNASNIVESIKNARLLFDYALEHHGLCLHLLDIGGGFPGTWQSRETFIEMSSSINSILDKYFPQDYFDDLLAKHQNTTNGFKTPKKFKIIGEPGTYYSCSAYTLCVSIISKKTINESLSQQNMAPLLNKTSEEERKKCCCFINGKENSLVTDEPSSDLKIDRSKSLMYFVNDTVHGSFKWYELSEGLPIFLRKTRPKDHSSLFLKTSIAGTSCDSCDFLFKDCYMPELDIGDYMIFKNMGSYTKTCAVNFNGIPLPKTVYVSSNNWNKIKQAFESDLEDSIESANHTVNILKLG